MNISKIYIIFYTLLLISCNSLASDSSASLNKDQHNPIHIDGKKLVESWVNLWNTYDLSMVDSIFLNDSRLSYFSSEKQGLIKGIEAVRQHHVGFGFVKGGKKQNNKLWLDELHSQTFGNTIIISGVWYFQKNAGDSPTIQKGPVTFVYVQENTEYRISHVHFANY